MQLAIDWFVWTVSCALYMYVDVHKKKIHA